MKSLELNLLFLGISLFVWSMLYGHLPLFSHVLHYLLVSRRMLALEMKTQTFNYYGDLEKGSMPVVRHVVNGVANRGLLLIIELVLLINT